MKRIIFALLLVGSGALAQTPTETPGPSPSPTPQLTPIGPIVPRYVSLVRFEAHDQYGPSIPQGQKDISYEFVISDQNGNEVRRYTHVLTSEQIPDREEAGLVAFLVWLRTTIETRTLPAESLTPFATLTPTPVPPTPAPSPTP